MSIIAAQCTRSLPRPRRIILPLGDRRTTLNALFTLPIRNAQHQPFNARRRFSNSSSYSFSNSHPYPSPHQNSQNSLNSSRTAGNGDGNENGDGNRTSNEAKWKTTTVLSLMGASSLLAGALGGYSPDGARGGVGGREYGDERKFVQPSYASLKELEVVSFKFL